MQSQHAKHKHSRTPPVPRTELFRGFDSGGKTYFYLDAVYPTAQLHHNDTRPTELPSVVIPFGHASGKLFDPILGEKGEYMYYRNVKVALSRRSRMPPHGREPSMYTHHSPTAVNSMECGIAS